MAAESGAKRIVASAIVAVIIVLVFAGALVGVSRYSPPKAPGFKGKIVVGCITFPKGTPLYEASMEIKRGLELWADYANKYGINIQGQYYGVTIDCKEAGFTMREVRIVASNLVTSDGVDVIVAPPGNDFSKAVMEVGENKRVPVILTYANYDVLFTRGWNFSFMLMTPQFKTVNSVFKALSTYNVTYNNIAVLYEAVPTGELRNYSEGLLSYARVHKLNFVYSSAFTADNASNVVGEMVAEKANPNVIFVAAWSRDALSAVLKAINAEKGALRSLKHVVVIAPTTEIMAIQNLGQALDKVIYVSMWEPIAPISPFMAANLGIDWYGYTTSESFVEEYTQKYGREPTDLAALGYMAGLLVQYAYEKAGTLDHAAVAENIRNAYIMTFYGAVGFQGSAKFAGGARGLQEAHSALLVELVYTGNGLKKIIIWPEELRTEAYVAP
ncbi:MAG: ABC transporter substrate-binding protein [Desulfurococcales archaeon]|nr:ABC transporter substrate-binding protein [Desulfurococcales archaeon]